MAIRLQGFQSSKRGDAAEFGAICQDFLSRRQAGQVQSQEASEAEAEAAMVSEAPSAPSAASEVAAKNKMIQI